MQAAAKEVEAGGGTIDVLVNNAAIVGHPVREPAATSAEDLRAAYETNLFGPVRVTHAFMPLLRRAERPRLVMVSSSLGSLTEIADGVGEPPAPRLPVVEGGAGHGVGTQTPREGTDAILAAALDATGPSGRFLARDGVVPW